VPGAIVVATGPVPGRPRGAAPPCLPNHVGVTRRAARAHPFGTKERIGDLRPNRQATASRTRRAPGQFELNVTVGQGLGTSPHPTMTVTPWPFHSILARRSR